MINYTVFGTENQIGKIMKITRSFEKPLMISKNYISVLKTYVIYSKKKLIMLSPGEVTNPCIESRLAHLLDENEKGTFFCKYCIDLDDFPITTVMKNDTLNLPSTISTTIEQVIIKNSLLKTEEKFAKKQLFCAMLIATI